MIQKTAYTPRPYQAQTTDFIKANPSAFVLEDMGLGKTVSTLTALKELLDSFEIGKALIIAPLRVAAKTWPDEIEKWQHLEGLTVAVAAGENVKKRKEAICAPVDLVTINVENVPWLVAEYGQKWPFDTIVIDESSTFKSHNSQRFDALKMVLKKTQRKILLTGTPTASGMIGIWSQMYILDGGLRLGKNITMFRNTYFVEKPIRGTEVSKYELIPSLKNQIHNKIADITITINAEDHVKLPEALFIDRHVNFDAKLLDAYKAFEKEAVLDMLALVDNDVSQINAASAAALSTKLRQFAQGAVYDAERKVKHIHDLKLDELEELLLEANGANVLLFYQFQHDAERIMQRFAKGGKWGRIERVGGVSSNKAKDLRNFDDWNLRKIALLIAHPLSLSHGLNLQSGGDIIVWFGPTWSPELWLQANARLRRPGQRSSTVRIFTISIPGTVEDKMQSNVKEGVSEQSSMLKAVQELAQQYLNE